LGIASAARQHGLDFIPLAQENYWLVCLKSALETPALQQLMQILQTQAWQNQLNTVAGYEALPECGQVQSLKKMLPWWL
jgi:putative molybdopterin biosynthesis protein